MSKQTIKNKSTYAAHRNVCLLLQDQVWNTQAWLSETLSTCLLGFFGLPYHSNKNKIKYLNTKQIRALTQHVTAQYGLCLFCPIPQFALTTTSKSFFHFLFPKRVQNTFSQQLLQSLICSESGQLKFPNQTQIRLQSSFITFLTGMLCENMFISRFLSPYEATFYNQLFFKILYKPNNRTEHFGQISQKKKNTFISSLQCKYCTLCTQYRLNCIPGKTSYVILIIVVMEISVYPPATGIFFFSFLLLWVSKT